MGIFQSSGFGAPVAAAALRNGASVLAICAATLAMPAFAAGLQDSPAQAQAQQAGAADTSTGIGNSQPSAGPQTPAGGVAPSQAEADTATPEQAANQTDVVVTGIRASLRSAQAIKRNSEVVVDSISAEDIGALPDRSVTEALQRVPGVSISRFEAGVDPDHFSAQGSGVVVRGLTYTRSEINGRDSFSANNGRGLSFADVPSELLAGVDVFKSPSADMIEGGIAGTVNLRTRVPFDSPGLVLGGTLEQSYSDLISKSAPTVSVLASDRWHTGIGEFGLLGSFVRSELFTRSDGLQISNFGQRTQHADGTFGQPPAGPGDKIVYIPRGAAIRTQEYDRIRYGYSAAAQWRSNDESMTATFQFLRSDSREKWNEHALEIATDNVTSNGDSQPLPGTSFTFDDQGIFTGGIITGPNGYQADQNVPGDNRTPPNGLQSNQQSRAVSQRYLTNDFGANFKWKVTDRLGVNLDYQHVNSTVTNTDIGIWASSFQNVDIRMNGNDPAYVNFLPVTNKGTSLYQQPGRSSYIDPYNNFYRSAMDHMEDSDGNEDAARIDLDYSFPEDSWLNSIRAGYRFADRENTARFSTYNWGVLSEIWGGGGPVWLDDPINGVPNTVSNTGAVTAGGGGALGPQQPYSFGNFFRGAVNLPTGEGRLFVPTDVVQNYNNAVAVARQINSEWRASGTCFTSNSDWGPLAQRCGVVAGTPFLPGEINPIHERTHSAYGEARFGNRFGNGWNLGGNVGVRYVTTERAASGYRQFIANALNCTTDATTGITTPQLFCSLPPAQIAAARAFANGAVVPDSANINYHYWLPSVNLRLEVGGGLQFRAAFNKSIAPPEFGLTRDYYNVSLGVQDADIANSGGIAGLTTVGNPYLKPIRGDNYDLTAEWYFSSVGQLTVSLFKKDLYGVITNSTVRTPLTNNGVTYNIVVTTPENATDTGRVKGLEVGYQQTYNFLPGFLSGLGFSGNFTYVDASGVAQSTLSSTDPDVGAGRIATVDTSLLPLQGLSKYTFNLTPFYQRNGLELRAAYSWRSRYLLTTRDVIVPYAPVFSEATGTLDASVFYSINKNIRMGFQGVNLLNQVTETTQVINNNLDRRPRSWFVNDRRFTFSLRATFGS